MASEAEALVNTTADESVNYDAVFGKSSGERTAKFVQADTIIGEFRNPKRFYWVDWVFLVVATVSMLGVVGVTIERFVFFERHFINITLTSNSSTLAPCNSWLCEADVTFSAVLLINLAFCVFYCYDGLFRERPFEILAYAIAVFIIIIYIIVNYVLKDYEYTDSLRLARLILVVLFGPINILLAVGSWYKMGYLMFTIIGSNKVLLWAYRWRSLFLTLQYFNLQVMGNILALAFGRKGQLLELWEEIVLPLLFALMFVVIFIGTMAVLWELHVLSIVWYCVSLPFGVYYLYKLIETSVHWSRYTAQYYLFTSSDVCDPDTEDCEPSTFTYVGAAILIACVVGLAVTVLLYALMIVSQMNYGKGLKDKIHPPFRKCFHRQ